MSDWKIARLELDRTEGFPNGSPSRCYLLRLPLSDDGWIDEAERMAEPLRATVRRFWPNEADRSGYVVRRQDSWEFFFGDQAGLAAQPVRMEDRPLLLGAALRIVEPPEQALPFKVVTIEDD